MYGETECGNEERSRLRSFAFSSGTRNSNPISSDCRFSSWQQPRTRLAPHARLLPCVPRTREHGTEQVQRDNREGAEGLEGALQHHRHGARFR